MPTKILFLDDRCEEENWKTSFDEWVPKSVKTIYEKCGYKAIERLQENPEVKLVFLDLNFEGQPEQGEQILNKIKKSYPDLKIIILTSVNDVQLALKLVLDQKKASYYFTKGKIDSDQVKKYIEEAIKTYDLEEDAIRRTDVGMIMGEHPTMKEALRQAFVASDTDSTVLITGESGTGKELIARTVQANSNRKTEPFVRVLCSAISRELFESEMFGYPKGAFVGALYDKKGFFQAADKGTIFLDELGEMELQHQAKLLRVLQGGEFNRVNEVKLTKVDVRVIAATNRNLEELVSERLFRQDLYMRLNVLRIHLPPLRERKEDILLLAKYHLEKLNNKLGKSHKYFSEEVLEDFMRYSWPGNVRELENAIHRAIVTSKNDVLTRDDFSLAIEPRTGTVAQVSLEDALINTWISKVMSGDAKWDDIASQFRAASYRKQIIEGIIKQLTAKGNKPKSEDFAVLLGIEANYFNQLKNKLKIGK